MRTNTAFRLVHNRKKTKGKALLQVEVRLVNGPRIFISTGIYITSRQWSGTAIRGTETDALLNKQANAVIDKLRSQEIMQGKPLTSEQVHRLIHAKTDAPCFTQWALQIINKRSDLADYSRYTHRRAIRYLEESNITLFSDLNTRNITAFNEALHGKGLTQTSISKLHQVIKTYINKAIVLDFMSPQDNPYEKIKIPRGKHQVRVRLDDTEISALQQLQTTDKEILQARDAALLQLYTGVAYKDLCALTYTHNFRRNKAGASIEGLRKKNNEFYSVPIGQSIVTMLEKHRSSATDKLIPVPDRRTYNANLKTLGKLIQSNKVITSHVMRHSAASWWLRNNIPLADVKDMLGHQDINTTIIYAKLEKQHHRDQIDKLG